MIIIYGTSNCLHCLKSKQLAEICGFEHEYKSLSDRETKKEFFSRVKDPTIVPQIFWDEEHLIGYEEFKMKIDRYVEENK